jgi:hypothetical protein
MINRRMRHYTIALQVLLALLFFQFVLGMFANLFANFPPPPANPNRESRQIRR